jgi:hypothetical protein
VTDVSELTNAGLAGLLDISARRVAEVRGEGRLPLTPDGRRIDGRELLRRGWAVTLAGQWPDVDPADYHDARTANEVLKAQERKLRLEERKGKLVDKARALRLVHRLAKEERDAILGWPARAAAEMAAELGVDAHRLQTMLETRLRELLAERNNVRIAIT